MSILNTSHHSLSSNVTEPCQEDIEIEKGNLTLIFDRYKDRYAILPKEKGWQTENLYLYQGYWYPSKYIISIANVMASQDTFQANPNDIYLATSPKSGTTWIKALTFAIVNRTKYKKNSLSTHLLLVSNPHDCLPYIESEILRNKPTYMTENSPRIFATHIPYSSLPQSIIDYGCRIVYMCRNPKDVFVSLFHFTNKLREEYLGFLKFEEAFKMFCEGVTPCGPNWDHVTGYYEAGLKHPTRILFLTYENMSMDTTNNVIHLAEFLGYPFTKEEEAAGEVEEIVRMCSFENLKEVNKHGNFREGVPNHAFFREGKVGDWNNHLTDEMSQILDQITKEKFDVYEMAEPNYTIIPESDHGRKSTICKRYELYRFPDGTKKARCYRYGEFLKPDSNLTLKYHYKHNCKALKAANDPNQPILDNSGQVWTYDNDLAREMTMKCVIQMALPFGHFDNTHITNII
ncbi:hypothetical protein OSB04_023566 [Centaurea solstitialis]|uniref:Sulfotransferase n=1 Tax=Centaurea solstitialis TaxID=347529 RepID=A0AA38WB78_9ASTR|nr:hypothetical protein OSB04_023566 [Centaurea solstitialis]